MNTLGRSITASIFPDQQAYAALRTHWAGLVTSEARRSLTAAHHLFYLALLGRDWRASFTPISNARTLANGGYPNWELFRALRTIRSYWAEAELLAPFAGMVTPAMLATLRPLIAGVGVADFGPADYANGYPFDAYTPVAPAQALRSA